MIKTKLAILKVIDIQRIEICCKYDHSILIAKAPIIGYEINAIVRTGLLPTDELETIVLDEFDIHSFEEACLELDRIYAQLENYKKKHN